MRTLMLLVVMVTVVTGTLMAAPSETLITDLLGKGHKPLNGVIGTGIVGGEQLPGLPNFTVGVGIAGFKLDYTDINTGKAKSTFLPTTFAVARLGLFGGIGLPGISGLGSVSVGARYGIIPSGPENNVNFSGGEVRVGVLNDALATPSVSINTSYTTVSDIKFGSDTDDAQVTIKAKTLGVKLLVSKELLVFTPYAGIGIDKNKTESSYRITSLAINKSFEKETQDTRWLVGVELTPFPFFRLGVEYNSVGGDAAYALNLRIKLP